MSFERGKNIKEALEIGIEAEKKRCGILVLAENDFTGKPDLKSPHDTDILFLYSDENIIPMKKIYDAFYVIVCYGDQMRIIKRLDPPAAKLEAESATEIIHYMLKEIYPRKELNSCIYYFASLYDRWKGHHEYATI